MVPSTAATDSVPSAVAGFHRRQRVGGRLPGWPGDDPLPPAPARAHPRADEVLAGLDPEQREVAAAPCAARCACSPAPAPARPGRSPTGSRTACAPGVYAPQQVLAVTFTARAAGEMRGRLRELGVGGRAGAHLPLRRAAPAPLLLAAVVGGEPPELLAQQGPAGRRGRSRGRGCRLDRPLLRDLAAEIEWAKVSQVAPGRLRRARPPRPAASRRRARPGRGRPRCYAAYEEVKRARGVIDFEDVLLLTVGILEEPRRRRRAGARASTATSSSTSTRTSTRCSRRCSTCGSASATTSASSATPARPSTRSPAPRPSTCSGFRGRYPHAAWCGWCATTGRPRRSSALANGCSRGARGPGAGRGRAAWRSAPPAPSRPSPRTPTSRPRRPGRRAGSRALLAAGTPASEIAVLFRINAQSEVLEQALADAGVPYVLRGGERFFERPEVRQARAAAARRRRAADDGSDDAARRRTVRAVLVGGRAGRAEPPAGSGAVRERWESLRALVGAGRDWSRPRPEADLRRPRRRARRAGRRAARARPSRASRSRRCTRPRAWSGTRSSSSGSPRATLPITYADDRRRAVEEERRLLYVGVTRAREHLRAVLGARPARPAGAARRRAVARSSTACVRRRRPRRRRRPVVPAGGRARAPAARCRPSCAGCGAAAGRPAPDRTRGRCADCPPSTTRRCFERLRAWRASEAGAAGPGVRRLHRRHARGARRAAPAELPGGGSRASARSKLEQYGPACSRSWPASRRPGGPERLRQQHRWSRWGRTATSLITIRSRRENRRETLLRRRRRVR